MRGDLRAHDAGTQDGRLADEEAPADEVVAQVWTHAHLLRAPALLIANPPAGAIYSLDPTLRREFQSLPLRAVTGRPTTVTWRVDGAMIGTASSDRPVRWPLAVGSHEIEVRDAEGRRARTSIVVK